MITDDRPSVEGLTAAHLSVHEEPRFVWYQTVWSLASLYANHALESPRGSEQNLAESRRYAAVLAATAARTQLPLTGSRPPAERAKLMRFLRYMIEPSAIVLMADAVSVRVPARVPIGSTSVDDLLTRATLLRDAVDDDPDGAVARRLLSEYVLRPGRRWAPRAHYTIACYFAAHDPSEAFGQLKLAFDRKRTAVPELYLLANWAWSDPSLDFLRKSPLLKQEFSDLTAPYRGNAEVNAMLHSQQEDPHKR